MYNVFTKITLTGILIIAVCFIVAATWVRAEHKGTMKQSDSRDAKLGVVLIAGATLVLTGAVGTIWTM